RSLHHALPICEVLQRLRMRGVNRRRHRERKCSGNALQIGEQTSHRPPCLSIPSSKDLVHLSLWSSATAGSTIVKRRTASSDRTVAFVGTYSMVTSNSCASVESMKS